MGVNSTWIAAYDVVVTIGGVAQPCNDCTLKTDVEKWNASNLLGGGWREHGTGLRGATMSGSTVVDSLALKVFDLGALGTASFAVAGEQTHSGTGRILSVSKKGGADGGMMVSFEFEFTGLISTV